jgi:putative two-component system response regulator
VTASANRLWDRRSVTLVEHEPALLDSMAREARAIGFDCQTASAAESAIERLENHLTPVVVTDLRMPGRGGLWLVREIQRRWPEVAVIVVTAGAEEDSLRTCLAAGVHHYFLKPLHRDELHHALQSTWERQRTRQQFLRQKGRLERTIQRQTQQLRRTVGSAVSSLVRTLEARDSYTFGHSRRVRALALRLAESLHLDARSCKRLGLAARLHDIGKIGLAEGILAKPGLLDAQEMTLIRQHPALGERIVRPIIRNRTVLAAIRSHHERFDGLGYPDGLRGTQIPLLARIITVADCFDAMTSSRAYREPLAPADALDLLCEGAGSQFDPDLIAPFLSTMRQQYEPGAV